MGVWGVAGKHPSVPGAAGRFSESAPGPGVLQVQQSQACARTSSTAFPPRTGAAAAGGRRTGLPRPGPPLPALLLLLAVLPAAQERGAPGRRLLLHGLVRDHRHAGVQVSAGRGRAREGRLDGGGARMGRPGRIPPTPRRVPNLQVRSRPRPHAPPAPSQRWHRRGVLWQRGDQ